MPAAAARRRPSGGRGVVRVPAIELRSTLGMTPTALSPSDLEQLETEGWVVARGIIPLKCITALQEEISAVVDRKARELHAEGKVKDLHADAGFLTRAALMYEQCPEIMSVLRGGTHAGHAMFDLLTCPVRI
eukprot:COSAG02_NODE_14525_length_1262_cov_1.273431_2_plen_132_part_00